MNIDDLKNIWSDDAPKQTPEINTEQRKRINLPLEKIRANMRMEFWSTVVCLIIVLVAIGFFDQLPFRYKLYLEILVISMSAITMFFYAKFFKLYKEIGNLQLETYESLKDLMHQFDLNKQYYLSFYVSFVPFLVCETIIILECIPYTHQFNNTKLALIFISSVVAGLFLLYLLGKFWFNYLYGKYIKKIETLIKELK